ncbi:hypothetical protein ACQ5SO_12290 [Rhodovulum sp. DZ06]|uniref:hypothetical protein n=1 Tax=Rhodovulum sp. DZ06 TaxID=3425126 RepID=UPI003D34D131
MSLISAAFCACACAALVIPAAAAAFELELRNAAGGQTLRLSLDDLDALPQARMVTETSWTEGMITFDGVAGEAIAGFAPPGAETVRASALNDYSFSIPLADFASGAAMVATRRDGALIPVRDKGPYWIVYDFTGLSRTDRMQLEARAVWHLKALEFN